jgi:hypothetical protein
MTYTTFVDLKINNAEQFKESLSEASANTNMYLTFGRIDAWANDSSPTAANSSIATFNEVWSNMIAGKKILGGDLCHVIPRFNWTANTVYTAYDHMSETLFDGNTQFYVVNSDYGVYKCISNNTGGMSTVEPTSVNPAITTSTSDGYVWKYMYTISDADQLRFTTQNYIPVKTLTTDDGSLQWQVQSEAEVGTIEAIYLSNTGSGYTNSSNIIVSVTGDGSSFSAQASVNTTTNTISSITVTNSGSGYTYADVTITDLGEGSGATGRAIISPPGGHGSDPLYELGGKNVMINTKFKYDEDAVFPVTNDFRQIAIIKDPISSLTSNVATNTSFLQATTLITAGTGTYTQDEIVYQGPSSSNYVFKGRVVSWDETTGKIILINTDGEPTAAQALVGVTSTTSRIVSSITNGLLEPRTGRILFVDNISPVTRSSDQIEDFRIVINF